MLRGEIWRYVPKGSPREQTVVIVSSDGINQSSRPWLLGAPLAAEDPEDILAVQLGALGWVSAGNLTRLYRDWLSEQVSQIDQETADQLDTALRAALDL